MGEGIGREPGKVQGLVEAHDEHPEGFEAALIERGLRWRDVGTPDFTWGDCWAVISTLPWDSPLNRQSNPEWVWDGPYTERLTILTEAAQHTSAKTPNWTKRQKRHLLHFVRPDERKERVTSLGNTPRPLAEMADWMAGRMAS